MPSVDITTTTINKQGIALSGRFCWRNQKSWRHAQYMANNHETLQNTLHNKTYGDEKRWPGWINKAGNNTKPWIMTRNRTSDPHIHKPTTKHSNNNAGRAGYKAGHSTKTSRVNLDWLRSSEPQIYQKQQDNTKCESWMASFIGTSDTHQPTTTSRVNLDWLRLSEPQIY